MVAGPKILIIIRAGAGSIHRSWSWTTNGFADIALSIYDDADFPGENVKYFHRAAGGKFPGIKAFFEAHPSVLENYDYYWLFEDDLVLPLESLRRISMLLGAFPFELSAPSLSYYSYFTWPITVRNSRFIFRATDFVEVMAPIMSVHFLRAALVAFNDNFSGWGHEWLWRKLLNKRSGFAAIFDCAPITHSRPFGSGTLVGNKPPSGWNPGKDMDEMIARYDLDRETPFRNYFGVTYKNKPSILVEDDFLQEAINGYSEMQGLPSDSFVRCIDTLIRGARPTSSISELETAAGFRLVADALADAAPLLSTMC